MHEGNKNKRLELEMDRVITKLINCNYIRIKKRNKTLTYLTHTVKILKGKASVNVNLMANSKHFLLLNELSTSN